MYQRVYYFLLLLFFLLLTCKDNPTDSDENKSNTSDTTVTDIDGNVYKIVKIGLQWWMAENLKVTHYRNGDAIPNVTDDGTWASFATGAYCSYDNADSNIATYGLLYNWYAVDDNRNIAPSGWHVPTDDEWQTLLDSLGGNLVAGGKMKEAGFTHWWSPNTGATNESGFTAIPGGYRRDFDGMFGNMGIGALFWSSTQYYNYGAWYYSLGRNTTVVQRNYYDEHSGFSLRCVRD